VPPYEKFGLKCLAKIAVVETSQVRHVFDERKLLALVNSPFVLKLFGVYQTPHQCVMVTEVIDCGDLWSVVYETPPYCDNGGLSVGLASFYTAILTVALSHIHQQGIVFRDLKPENIMLDRSGYLRIIDFGFAKVVPYTKLDSDGIEQLCSKTYTLCGTPEYLAPELIFNLGHDQSADLWALGIVIYEMLVGKTPFAPKRPENVTELFTNIAMVKKNGLVLSSELDEVTGGMEARSLVTALLKPSPNERMGVQEGATSFILTHPFFSSTDVEAITNRKIEPEYIPFVVEQRDPISNLPPIRPYYGDQKIFEEW
jgi:serine/threonine protein kinase